MGRRQRKKGYQRHLECFSVTPEPSYTPLPSWEDESTAPGYPLPIEPESGIFSGDIPSEGYCASPTSESHLSLERSSSPSVDVTPTGCPPKSAFPSELAPEWLAAFNSKLVAFRENTPEPSRDHSHSLIDSINLVKSEVEHIELQAAELFGLSQVLREEVNILREEVEANKGRVAAAEKENRELKTWKMETQEVMDMMTKELEDTKAKLADTQKENEGMKAWEVKMRGLLLDLAVID